MKLKELIDHGKAGLAGALVVPAASVALLLGISVANLPGYALETVAEVLADSPRVSYRARLVERGSVLCLGTHGSIATGKFDVGNNKTIQVIDAVRVLDGKIAANTVLPSLVEGRDYEVNLVGSERSGYKIVSASEVK